MKVFIIEDEMMAKANLIKVLTEKFNDIEVIGSAGSVKEAVKWLKNPENNPDVIFMDVELSDGDCFEIFKQVKIKSKVVMTTAYDNYAVKAFEAGSIDYVLKPIDYTALSRAIARCRMSGGFIDMESISKALQKPDEYKQRFIVRINDHIIPLRTSEIAYFYSEEKNTFVVTENGKKYIVDLSLDVISEELDPSAFFRISRGCIIAMNAIKSIVKQLGGRLKIEASPESTFDMTVSRSRVDDFLLWIEK